MTKWEPYQNMLQFDSPGRGLLMMFEIATISSWNSFSNAAAYLCSDTAPLYFFTVRIVLNMIFVPIIAGYILESFVKKFAFYEKLEKEQEEKEEMEEKAAEILKAAQAIAEASSKSNDMESGETKKNADDEDDDGFKEEELFNALEKKKKQLKYKTLTEHSSIDGFNHTVQLKQRTPLDSKEMIENEMLGVAADKKAKKFVQISKENVELKNQIGRLEGITRTAKRNEMAIKISNRKMKIQLTTLKEEMLKLRKEQRNNTTKK